MNLLPHHSLFDFDTLFDHIWPQQRAKGESNSPVAFAPRVDVKEKDKSYEISAELPGVNKADVHVNLEQGILSIEAESNQESKQEEDGKIIRQERHYGKLRRSFNLGDVNDTDIHASFKNGVLNILVPKSEEHTSEVKQIPIK